MAGLVSFIAQGQPGVLPARWLDMPAVCRIEMRGFGADRLLAGWWQQIGGRGTRSWVARVDRVCAGYVITQTRPFARPGADPVPALYVAGVGVSPAFQRRGIGRALMDVVIAASPCVWLHVRASNTAAIGLYAGLEFREQRVLPGFYRNGEDAFLMARGIAPL